MKNGISKWDIIKRVAEREDAPTNVFLSINKIRQILIENGLNKPLPESLDFWAVDILVHDEPALVALVTDTECCELCDIFLENDCKGCPLDQDAKDGCKHIAPVVRWAEQMDSKKLFMDE